MLEESAESLQIIKIQFERVDGILYGENNRISACKMARSISADSGSLQPAQSAS